MSDRIAGASVWDQEMYDRMRSHVENERTLIAEYATLLTETSSPALRYLANLIVDEERRHHQQFADLAEAVRALAEVRVDESPIPLLGHGVSDDERHRVEELTDKFLRSEEEDARELRALKKDLKPVRDTTLWHLLVELMEADTAKHIRILKFIRDRARHPIA